MFGASELTQNVVKSAIAGSQADLHRVAEAMLPQVRLMVSARLCAAPGQAHTVEDITQAVMMALTTGIERIQTPSIGGLKAYTSRIVANKVADYLRDHRGDGRDRPLASIDSTIDAFSQAGPLWQFLSQSGTTPLSAIDRNEQATRMMDALHELRDDQREIIILAFFDQLSTSEIAERRNIERPAASMQLIRAIKALRRKITGSSQVRTPHA